VAEEAVDFVLLLAAFIFGSGAGVEVVIQKGGAAEEEGTEWRNDTQTEEF